MLVFKNCPKCGYRIPYPGSEAGECPACGIVMSKWQAATRNPTAGRREGSGKPRRPIALRGLLPLLLLLVASVLMWRQMPEPLPDSPRVAPPSQSGETSPLPIGQPESSSGVSNGNASSASEALAESTSEGTVDAPSEPEIPPGGQSPLDWRPSKPLAERPTELRNWYRDYDGYIRALRRRSHVERPMILYFRSDWCPWSRRFEREFLDRREIANWASEQIRVVFDVDSGPEEEALVEKLGIGGLPAFLVIPVGRGEPKAIEPFPEGEPISPEDFLARGRTAAQP